MNIAIVDDAKAVHAYLVDVFDGSKATLTHYYNGQEAVDALSRTEAVKPDVVLLDWEMPILCGIDALPKLRATQTDTPILMMTSKNQMSDIVRALESGAHDYIMKPFTREILIEKIEHAVGKKVA